MKIITEDGFKYEYYIDKNPNELGYSLATFPIIEKINSKLFLILDADIKYLNECNSNSDYESIYGDDDEYSSEIWPVSIEELVGKYYEKDGFVYYNLENHLYKFRFRLNYFREIYKSKINCA
jgi:hypothetical protein